MKKIAQNKNKKKIIINIIFKVIWQKMETYNGFMDHVKTRENSF